LRSLLHQENPPQIISGILLQMILQGIWFGKYSKIYEHFQKDNSIKEPGFQEKPRQSRLFYREARIWGAS
jgi:hypothetical protein